MPTVTVRPEWPFIRGSRRLIQAIVTINVRYFAVLREERGVDEEQFTTGAGNVADLYSELQSQFSFSLSQDRLQVACNGDFVSWHHRIADGDLVVFIPPLAGG